MTFALWCVLAAALLPLVLTGLAKAGNARETGVMDNHNPRDVAEKLQGPWRRLNAAHQNGFEAFPFFAAAVIVAELRDVPQGLVNGLAAVWLVARLAHAYAYYADAATLRSGCWAAAWLAAAALLTSPAWA